MSFPFLTNSLMSISHSYIVAFWSPFPPSDSTLCIGYFSSLFQRYGDIVCLDLRDHHDIRTKRLLREADLVVITLRQSHREFNSLFCQPAVSLANFICLITDYVPDDTLSLKYFTHEFRIPPSRLACIPYSPRMREGKKWPDISLLSAEIRRELAHAGQIMLLALGF